MSLLNNWLGPLKGRLGPLKDQLGPLKDQWDPLKGKLGLHKGLPGPPGPLDRIALQPPTPPKGQTGPSKK